MQRDLITSNLKYNDYNLVKKWYNKSLIIYDDLI